MAWLLRIVRHGRGQSTICMWCEYRIAQACRSTWRTPRSTPAFTILSRYICRRAYAGLGYGRGDFPVTEKIATEIVSLPMFPQLSAEQRERVVGEIAGFCKNRSRRKPAFALFKREVARLDRFRPRIGCSESRCSLTLSSGLRFFDVKIGNCVRPNRWVLPEHTIGRMET